MFDITKEFPADTASIHLKGLRGDYLYNDDGKPVQIVVYGPGTKQFAAMESRQTTRTLKRMKQNDGEMAVGSPEQTAKEQAEDLASITSRFENFDWPVPEGTSDFDKFQSFYLNEKTVHFKTQVKKALGETGNFIANSGTEQHSTPAI